MSTDIKSQLSHTIKELEFYLDQFTHYLRSLEPSIGRIFVLPDITPENEHLPIKQIEVNAVTDFSSFDAGLRIWQQLFAKPGHSTKAAVRIPGALCFHATPSQQIEINKLANQINCTKRTFYQYVQTLKTADLKFTVVHDLFPMLITLNVYRTIKVFNQIQAISFGWARKDSIQYVTREDILKRLTHSQAHLPTSHEINPQDWIELVEQEILAVSRLPTDARLKIQRPVPIQPIARVKQQYWQQVPCPTPLLVLNDGTPPSMNYLADYDEKGSKGRYRKTTSSNHLIIPRLHLYASKI